MRVYRLCPRYAAVLGLARGSGQTPARPTRGAEGAAHLAANLGGHAQRGALLPQHGMPVLALVPLAACMHPANRCCSRKASG